MSPLSWFGNPMAWLLLLLAWLGLGLAVGLIIGIVTHSEERREEGGS